MRLLILSTLLLLAPVAGRAQQSEPWVGIYSGPEAPTCMAKPVMLELTIERSTSYSFKWMLTKRRGRKTIGTASGTGLEQWGVMSLYEIAEEDMRVSTEPSDELKALYRFTLENGNLRTMREELLPPGTLLLRKKASTPR